MEIGETRHGDVIVLSPDGSLGSAPECTKLDQRLSGLLEKRTQAIVVDLVHVRRISGAALRTLLVVKRRLASADGALVLCRLSEKVLKVFEIAGFDRDFTIVPTLDEAMKAVTSSAAPAAADSGVPGAEGGVGPSAATATPAPAEPAPAADPTRFAERLILALTGADGPTLRSFTGHQTAPSAALVALAERARSALGCS